MNSDAAAFALKSWIRKILIFQSIFAAVHEFGEQMRVHGFAVLRIKFTTPWISKSRKINRILDHRESIANIWIRTQLIFLQACRFAEL